MLIGHFLLKLNRYQASLKLVDCLTEDVDGRNTEHSDEEFPDDLHFSECRTKSLKSQSFATIQVWPDTVTPFRVTVREETGVFKVCEFDYICCTRPPKLRQSAI